MEYAAAISSPHMRKHVKKIERIQRLATRMIPGFKELPYEERLMRLDMTTLEERRMRGNLLTVYRIVNGIDILDRDLIEIAPRNYLRGHTQKLRKDICLSDVKKYSFPYRSTVITSD